MISAYFVLFVFFSFVCVGATGEGLSKRRSFIQTVVVVVVVVVEEYIQKLVVVVVFVVVGLVNPNDRCPYVVFVLLSPPFPTLYTSPSFTCSNYSSAQLHNRPVHIHKKRYHHNIVYRRNRGYPPRPLG